MTRADSAASMRNDLELFAIVLIWGFNVTVVKVGLGEMEPLAYNLVRFLGASTVLLGVAWRLEGTLAVRREDLGRLILLGVVGHTIYQICFIEGLARTTASSASILFGSSPVVIGLMSRLAGHERIRPAGAAGALLGFYGVYLIVAGGAGAAGAPADGATPGGPPAAGAMAGNLLIVVAVVCWGAYTVLARGLLQRYSPLKVTALTLALGTPMLIPPAVPQMLRQDWGAISALTWAGLVFSLLFALVIAYVVWYRSVRLVGNLRTAIYSNLVPVFGTLFGVWLLHDRLNAGLALGAACILGGIVMTRLRRQD